MNDELAIELFEAEGNPREDWWALDERDRYPWRKKALEMGERPFVPAQQAINPANSGFVDARQSPLG